MREIEFRGISITSKEWVTSMTIAKGTIKRKRDCVYMEVSEDKWVQVDPATVGQFTGHKDKDGTRIFEGDLLCVANNITYEVAFITQDENEERIAAYGLKREGKEPFAIDEYAIKHGKVIGNVHQNKAELK